MTNPEARRLAKRKASAWFVVVLVVAIAGVAYHDHRKDDQLHANQIAGCERGNTLRRATNQAVVRLDKKSDNSALRDVVASMAVLARAEGRNAGDYDKILDRLSLLRYAPVKVRLALVDCGKAYP